MLLNLLTTFSGLLPIGVASLRYRSLGPVLRPLAWFFFLSGAFDLATSALAHSGVRNIPLFHLFAFINLLFLSWLYSKILAGRWIHRGIIAATAGILVFGAYRSLLPGQLWQFPSAFLTAQCMLFIVLALLYFYQLLQQPEVVAIEHNPFFWITAGVLLYFASNLFLFMLPALISNTKVHYEYYAIHSVVNILAYILYAVGLLCKPPRLT